MLPKHKRLTAKKKWNHFVQKNNSLIAQLIALIEDPVKTPEHYVENFQQLNQIRSVLQTSENLMLVQESASIKIPMGRNEINLFQVYELVIQYYFEFYMSKREVALDIHPTLISELVSFIKDLSWCTLHVSSYHEVFQLLTLHMKHNQLESPLAMELLSLVEELFHKVCEKAENGYLNGDFNLKQQSYTLMLSLYVVFHERYPDQVRWSQVTTFFEQIKSQKIDLPYKAYINLLYLFAKKETPNLNYIGYIFGKLYGHLLYLKKDNSLDKEALHDFTIAISFYYQAITTWSSRIEAMTHQEAVLKKESLDQMLFISERIMNLSFIKLPQMPLAHWYALLSILVAHKHLLSENQQEKIYSIAQYVLNCLEFDPESRVFHRFTQKSKLLSLCFNLIASTQNPQLAKVKPIYDAFQSRVLQGDDYEAGYDEVVRILLKAKQFTAEDIEPLFESLIKLRPDKKVELLFHIITEASLIDAQYLSLINTHTDVIMQDKALFNQLIKCLNQEQISQLNKALPFQEEHKHGLAWQTKQALYMQEVEMMECLPSFKKAKVIYLAFLQKDVCEWSAEYLPSEWSLLQQQLWDEFSLLHELVSEAKSIDVNANRFILEFVQTLQQTIDIQRLVNNRQTASQEIATEKALIAEARQQWVSINEARELVKSNNYEKLVRIHRGFVITAESLESHLIKIKTLLKLGYNHQAFMWLQQTQLQFPGQKSKELMLHWADYYKAIGDYFAALSVYEQLSQFKSTPLQQAYNKLNQAWCHQQAGKETGFDSALSLYDELLSEAILPQSTILQAKVRCLLASNRLAQAQELINGLGEQEDARFYALMASFNLQQGHYKEAIEYYKKALAREKHLGWIKALLHCYTADSCPDKQEMQGWMASLLRKADNSQEGQAIQIIIYIKMKQYKKALECIDLIRQEYGPSQFVCIQTALCHRKMGQMNAAIAELNSFAWHFKSQHVLKQLAITYSLANLQLEALQCFDYLLAEYPLFVSAYINAFAFTIKTQQIDKLRWYWQLYQEQFGEEIGSIPPELYSSLQHHLSLRTVDSYIPLMPDELDAFITVELEADEALKTLNLHEETVSCLQNLQKTKINPRYFDVPVSNLDARYSSPSIAALDLAFFTPKRVQPLQPEESNQLLANNA